MRRFLPAALLIVTAALGPGGCIVAGLAAAMGQSAEHQKRIEVLARYRGLENKRIAVVAQADLSLLYDHPLLVPQVMAAVSQRIQQHVPGVEVIPVQSTVAWQHGTPQWQTLPYGQVAEGLNVDRIVFVEIMEYRLHPPGNSFLWDGACLADVGIVERDSFDPDMYAELFHVEALFPDVEGLSRESANRRQIETGVLATFVRNVSWLFYDHLEPKYPKHYRGDLNP